MMNKVAISVQGLSKDFAATRGLKALFRHPFRGERIEVLRQINLEVFTGGVLGLLGANGAGKTTLLDILATILLPTNGKAWVCGFDVVSQAGAVRNVVGYCACEPQSFYPRLTGLDNLQFFALLNDFAPQEAEEKIHQTLELVGIDGVRTRAFQSYSAGMKQRLSLARALLTDPDVLLLDEPTRSLDPLLQQEIWRFLRRTLVEKLEKTVLLVTHNLEEAEEVCDRVAIMHEGTIVSVGTPAEIRQSLESENLAVAFEKAVSGEC